MTNGSIDDLGPEWILQNDESCTKIIWSYGCFIFDLDSDLVNSQSHSSVTSFVS